MNPKKERIDVRDVSNIKNKNRIGHLSAPSIWRIGVDLTPCFLKVFLVLKVTRVFNNETSLYSVGWKETNLLSP